MIEARPTMRPPQYNGYMFVRSASHKVTETDTRKQNAKRNKGIQKTPEALHGGRTKAGTTPAYHACLHA